MQVCPTLELAVGFVDCAQQIGERAVLVNRVEPRKLGSKLGDFAARKETDRDYAILVLTLVAPYRHHRSERPPPLHGAIRYACKRLGRPGRWHRRKHKRC